MGQLEDFLKGKPLNEELAAIRDPQVAAGKPTAPLFAVQPSVDDPDRELDDGERTELQRLLASGGWRVLERLNERTCRRLEKAAIVVSQDKPLENERSVAQGWAYLGMWKQARQQQRAEIEAEVAKLRAKPTDAEMVKLRTV